MTLILSYPSETAIKLNPFCSFKMHPCQKWLSKKENYFHRIFVKDQWNTKVKCILIHTGKWKQVLRIKSTQRDKHFMSAYYIAGAAIRSYRYNNECTVFLFFGQSCGDRKPSRDVERSVLWEKGSDRGKHTQCFIRAEWSQRASIKRRGLSQFLKLTRYLV